WPGWGESSYQLYRAAERQRLGPATIACNGDPPFYRPPDLGFTDAGLNTIGDLPALRARLQRLAAERVGYLLVTNSYAYRRFAPHYLAVDQRERAILVDSLGGVEYGWLYRIDDLVRQP